MKLTIAYLTFRLDPHFDWFCASLAREFRSMPDIVRDDVQILVIDGRLWHEEKYRRSELVLTARGYLAFDHHAPKPSPWQGPHRQTKRDYFAAANARNTAIAYARGEHVIFVDDLSVLLPGWLKAHVHAAHNRYVLAGTTSKQKNLVVGADGEIVAFEEYAPGRDSRLKYIDHDLQDCGGEWLFGGTFSVPLALALAVNGQDEINDTIGGEDYDFGIRLGRAGGILRIARTCGTYEDETAHGAELPMVRLDKAWAGEEGPYASNFLAKKLMREAARSWTLGNDYSLRAMREEILFCGGEFPIPKPDLRHWVDGQWLSEM